MARFKTSSKPLRTFKPAPRKVPAGNQLLDIESLASDGRGISRAKGKPVLVVGALAGEQVKARYTAVHKRYDEAELVKVVTASPLRVVPCCQYAGSCGGCNYQQLDYSAQLDHKQQQLQQQFASLLATGSEPLAPLSSQPLHYRHRARLAVKADKQGCKVGFRQAQSHQLVDIDHCQIIYQSLSDSLPSIKTLLASLARRSVVTEVSLCEDSDGKQGLMLACKKALHTNDYPLLESYAAEQNLRIEVHWTEGRDDPVTHHWQTGLTQLHYRLAGATISLPFTLTDFTQVNPLINQQLIDCARDWLQLSLDDTLADYFCGLGNFSLSMAAQLESVYGYELSASMVAKASAAAADNGISNSFFRVSNLMAADAAINRSANKVLLDPPRAGAEVLCRQLALATAERIVYISCNTDTLLRDAEILTKQHYQLEKICLADMFPQTRHSEAIALFSRVKTQ